MSELEYRAEEKEYNIYNDSNFCFIAETIKENKKLDNIDLQDIAESLKALQYTIRERNN